MTFICILLTCYVRTYTPSAQDSRLFKTETSDDSRTVMELIMQNNIYADNPPSLPHTLLISQFDDKSFSPKCHMVIRIGNSLSRSLFLSLSLFLYVYLSRPLIFQFK